MRWSLAAAEQRFGELVQQAHDQGPQIVMRHGHDLVVVTAVHAPEPISRPRPGFKEFLRSAPYFDDLEFGRSLEGAPVVDP
jgi:prevent-host-death family protein